MTDPTHEPWWDQGPVLSDHKRHKKKLVPPLLRLPQMSFVSTLDQIFPELFWMCLIFQDVGPHQATRTIIPALKALYQIDPKLHWYRTSVMLTLTDVSSEQAAKNIKDTNFQPVERALSLLRRVYCARDSASGEQEIASKDIRQIEETVRRYWDKSSSEYCSVLATLMVGLGVSGAGRFPSSMLENVNEILENPGSDLAEATSSGLRAASMAMFPMEEDESARQWCRTFWNKNYTLSRCEFRGE